MLPTVTVSLEDCLGVRSFLGQAFERSLRELEDRSACAVGDPEARSIDTVLQVDHRSRRRPIPGSLPAEVRIP